MNLLKNKEVFKEIVSAVSAEKKFSELIIEKDYMVSLLLEQLSKIESVSIVFKGGTSLSKCYKVIERFSEDIDIAIQMEPSEIKNKNKKDLKREILNAVESVGFKHIAPNDVRSRRDFNRYHIEYPKIYDDSPSINPNIIIESIVAYKPYPCEELMVSNYIIDYLEENGNNEIINKYELKRFHMQVQSIDRTFVDKLYALCDYHLEQKYERYSRHLYDIHKIWNSEILDKSELKALANLVSRDRQTNSSRNFSCNPGMKPKEVLDEIIEKMVFKDDYTNITTVLIYDDISYEQCTESLEEIIKYGILPEEIVDYDK